MQCFKCRYHPYSQIHELFKNSCDSFSKRSPASFRARSLAADNENRTDVEMIGADRDQAAELCAPFQQPNCSR